MDQDDRRKASRSELGLPVKIKGYDPDGAMWEEMATTVDASAGGLSFPSSHVVKKGQILHLTLPLPRSLREFDFQEPEYRVYTLVRDTSHQDNGHEGYRVGVMFFGKMPPRGYQNAPGARFLLPWDTKEDEPAQAPSPRPRPAPAEALGYQPAPGDRRRSERYDRLVNVTLQQQDEWGMVVHEELAVTENIGKGGARVMTTHGYAKGDMFVVQEIGGGFATRAEVRDVASDGPIRRLSLKFLDGEVPDRLLKV